MIDLHEKTIQRLFQKQVEDLTKRTLITREDSLDIQFSGAWI